MTQYINLYRSLRDSVPTLKPAALLGAALLITVVILGALAFAMRMDESRLRSEQAALTARVEAGRARLLAVGRQMAVRKAEGAGEAAALALENRFKAREEMLKAYQDGTLGNRQGFGEYLQAFARRAGQGVWLTGFQITQGGVALSVSGRSLDAERIPAYLQQLRAEPVFKGRSFEALRVRQVEEGKESDNRRRSPQVEFHLGTEVEAETATAGSGGMR